MSFDNLGLSAELVRVVREKNYTVPTPIQEKAIPTILSGHDVLAAAQTGTGKTAAFTLPLLQRLSEKPSAPVVRALVLTPTRELAAQVENSVRTYGKHFQLRSTSIFGGVGMGSQLKALRRGVDIVVATPGRLIDHIENRSIDLSSIEMLVLDEADRMLDMGFIPAIRKILALLPKVRQNLMFSATFSSDIKQLANSFLTNPVTIEVMPSNNSANLVTQRVYPVEQKNKRDLLTHLIKSNDWRQVLVFIRTKYNADRLAKQLSGSGLKSSAIHGNKTQGARTKALADFKSGAIRVLVATDVAARGLDIDQLPHVVNFDLPQVPEDYVHRIGRTGRAGNEGVAVSLVNPEQRDLLRAIERMMKIQIRQTVIPEYGTEKIVTERPAKPKSEKRKSKTKFKEPAKQHTESNSQNKQRNGKSFNGKAKRDTQGNFAGKPSKPSNRYRFNKGSTAKQREVAALLGG